MRELRPSAQRLGNTVASEGLSFERNRQLNSL